MEAYSAEKLVEMFYNATDPLPRAGRVDVPKRDFDDYADLYNRSYLLLRSLKNVLEYPEHTLFMMEAAQIYPEMPDMDRFEEAVCAYEQYLGGIKLSDQTYRYHKNLDRGVMVNIPVETARKLNDLVRLNCELLGTIFSGWFDTDYGKHFTYMKRNGVPYTGPHAFREIMAVHAWLTHMKKESKDLSQETLNNRRRENSYEPVQPS